MTPGITSSRPVLRCLRSLWFLLIGPSLTDLAAAMFHTNPCFLFMSCTFSAWQAGTDWPRRRHQRFGEPRRHLQSIFILKTFLDIAHSFGHVTSRLGCLRPSMFHNKRGCYRLVRVRFGHFRMFFFSVSLGLGKVDLCSVNIVVQNGP